MASVSAKATARRLRRGPTFIQRSRAVSSEQKAIYHHVTGAGRSQVKREFFDLDTEDQTSILQKLEDGLRARLTRTGA
jgi:gentisate 1,2-dioxygenase